ncbi:MAG: glycosyltransferase, partial [Planctomycetota bacterium]
MAVVRDDDRPHLDALVADLRRQTGGTIERCLIDATRLGDLEADLRGQLASEPSHGAEPEIRVVRPERHSVARALRSLAERADVLVPFVPGSGAHPERCARIAAALGADPLCRGIAHGLALSSSPSTPERPADDPERPGPAYAACIGLRADVLARLDPRAFRPCLLETLRTVAADGGLRALGETLASLPEELAPSARRAAEAESRWLELEGQAPPAQLPATVIMAHHRRPDAIFECLEALARQTVGPRQFDVVICDDASPAEEVEALRALQTPFDLRVVHQDGGGATNARNLGLPHVRGELLVFINDDSICDDDLIERHLAAHAEYSQPVIVLGNFRQTEEEQRLAVVGVLERTTHMFAFSAMEPGQVCSSGTLYTCNASVRTELVRELNGFDAEFTLYAEDTELGIRFEEAGVPIVYRPECGAIHRHRIDVAHVERRYPAVGLAHARLFRAQPRAYVPWEGMWWTEEWEARASYEKTRAAHAPLLRALHGIGN